VTVAGGEPLVAAMFATGTRVGRYEIVEPWPVAEWVCVRAYDPSSRGMWR